MSYVQVILYLRYEYRKLYESYYCVLWLELNCVLHYIKLTLGTVKS